MTIGIKEQIQVVNLWRNDNKKLHAKKYRSAKLSAPHVKWHI